MQAVAIIQFLSTVRSLPEMFTIKNLDWQLGSTSILKKFQLNLEQVSFNAILGLDGSATSRSICNGATKNSNSAKVIINFEKETRIHSFSDKNYKHG